MKLINIGFGNMVSAGRVVAVVSPDSAPVKRLIKEARERGSFAQCLHHAVLAGACRTGNYKQIFIIRHGTVPPLLSLCSPALPRG